MSFDLNSLIARLPAEIQQLLLRVSSAAAPLELPIWLVGGVVRDLLLELPIGRDIDIAVEGDPHRLAAALTSDHAARSIALHPRFSTATVDLDGFSVDLIRTRRESYREIAALPDVEPSDITDDLLRRDFSMNALGLRLGLLDGELCALTLADPTGGLTDLRNGILRLLHPRSLFDDPTRLLRGVRLAARLQLQVDAASQALIGEAVAQDLLAAVSNERLQNELCLLLDEPDPAAVIDLAENWGLRAHFCRAALGGPPLAARLQRLRHDQHNLITPSDQHLVIAGLIAVDLQAADIDDLLVRFTLPRPYQRLLRQLPELLALLPELRTLQLSSRIDRLLQPFEPAACAVVHYAAQPDDNAATLLATYLRTLRPCRAPLDGNQLRRLGVPAGPVLGDFLRDLRAATLDGAVHDESSARDWVLRRLAGASSVPDA